MKCIKLITDEVQNTINKNYKKVIIKQCGKDIKV